MLIGAMNDPARNLFEQIRSFGEAGMGFLDLTLEPPESASRRIDTSAVREALKQHNLGIVGHTAPYPAHRQPH